MVRASQARGALFEAGPARLISLEGYSRRAKDSRIIHKRRALSQGHGQQPEGKEAGEHLRTSAVLDAKGAVLGLARLRGGDWDTV